MFDVTAIIGLGLVFAEDDEGRTIIDCERGYVYAADDAHGEHYVAVLIKGTAEQRHKLFSLGLPTRATDDRTYTVRCTPATLAKVLKVLKPKQRPLKYGSTQT
jgi:hypothetical protein